MSTPTPDRSHVVTTWRDRNGQHWFHATCTCGATTGAPTAEERDAEILPHRLAGAEHAGTVTR